MVTREGFPEEAVIGPTGGSGSSDGVPREDGVTTNPVKSTHDHEKGSRMARKTSVHDEWASRPARDNLSILGWSRARAFVSPEPAGAAGPPAEENQDPEGDPLARMLGNWLWFGEGSAMTATSLHKMMAKGKSEDELRSVGWPASPREMQERMERVAPSLQGKTPFHGPHPPRRDRFVHLEYWKKEGSGEGLWVLIPAREGGPTEEEIEQIVWGEVVYLEGLNRYPNPFRDD